MTATDELKHWVERMLDGQTNVGATLWLGEEAIESATGKSRGEGSISVLEAARYPAGDIEILTINDESNGYRGTVRKNDFFGHLDAEFDLASNEGRTLRFEIGSRDRRAMWQHLNDDAARGGVV